MECQFRGSKIFFEYFDFGGETVNIYLHGWGRSCKELLFFKDHIKQSSLFIDFPPFGKSDKNISHWSIFTYVNLVCFLCEQLDIKNFNLIGHSFGGRVAILLSVLCKSQTKKLVLLDSAGLKPRRNLKYYLNVWKFKHRKKKGLDVSKFGSEDFRSLPDNIKPIFISVVNTHLDEFLMFINCKTLIMFGQQDKTTPLYMAKRLNRKIRNSQLVVLKNCGHFCYVDRKVEVVCQLKNFLKT